MVRDWNHHSAFLSRSFVINSAVIVLSVSIGYIQPGGESISHNSSIDSLQSDQKSTCDLANLDLGVTSTLSQWKFSDEGYPPSEMKLPGDTASTETNSAASNDDTGDGSINPSKEEHTTSSMNKFNAGEISFSKNFLFCKQKNLLRWNNHSLE